ncbi:DUF3106 domain-containing protein [Luteimonas sp. e5]
MNPARMFSPLLITLLMTSAALPLRAQETPVGNWNSLSAEQRELLIQPLRERWDAADAEKRQRMYRHAQRWREMPVEERARARRGHDRFGQLTAEQQQQLRVLYDKTRDLPYEERRQALVLFHVMRKMPAAEREALRQRWGRMNAAERDAWMQENAPQRPSHRGAAKP